MFSKVLCIPWKSTISNAVSCKSANEKCMTMVHDYFDKFCKTETFLTKCTETTAHENSLE